MPPRAKKARAPAVWWGLGVEHEYLIQSSDGTFVPSRSVVYGNSTGSNAWSVSIETSSVIASASRRRLSDAAVVEIARYMVDHDMVSPLSAPAFVKAIPQGASSVREILRTATAYPLSFTLHRGDLLAVSCCGGDEMEHVVVIRASGRSDPGGVEGASPPLTAEAVVRTIAELRRRYKAAHRSNGIVGTAGGVAFDVDGAFVESRSLRFRNETVDSVVKQLRDSEAAALRAASKVEGVVSPSIYPWSGYVQNNKTTHYAGSYHLWITLPTPDEGGFGGGGGGLQRTLQARRLVQLQHAQLSHALQWIEPLLLSTYSGDPRALGRTDDKFPRASMRADLNAYSGYGTTPVATTLDEPLHEGRRHQIAWFASEKDLVEDRHAQQLSEYSWPIYVWISGQRVPYQSCFGDTRFGAYLPLRATWQGYDGMIRNDGDAFHVPRNGLGSDIRSKLCESLAFPLRRGWTARCLRVGDALELRFVKGRQLLKDAPIDASRLWRGLTGIEFRAVDNMPSEGITPFLQLAVLLGAAAVSSVQAWGPVALKSSHTELQAHFEKRAAARSRSWQDALRVVRARGSHARVPAQYARDLWAEIGLAGGGPPPSPAGGAHALLNATSRALFDAFRTHGVYTKMVGDATAPPVFVNYNQLAWEQTYAAATASRRARVRRCDIDAPFLAAAGRDAP